MAHRCDRQLKGSNLQNCELVGRFVCLFVCLFVFLEFQISNAAGTGCKRKSGNTRPSTSEESPLKKRKKKWIKTNTFRYANAKRQVYANEARGHAKRRTQKKKQNKQHPKKEWRRRRRLRCRHHSSVPTGNIRLRLVECHPILLQSSKSQLHGV